MAVLLSGDFEIRLKIMEKGMIQLYPIQEQGSSHDRLNPMSTSCLGGAEEDPDENIVVKEAEYQDEGDDEDGSQAMRSDIYSAHSSFSYDDTVGDDSTVSTNRLAMRAIPPRNPLYTRHHIDEHIGFVEDRYSPDYGRAYVRTKQHKHTEDNKFLYHICNDLHNDGISVLSAPTLGKSHSTLDSWSYQHDFIKDTHTSMPQLYNDVHERHLTKKQVQQQFELRRQRKILREGTGSNIYDNIGNDITTASRSGASTSSSKRHGGQSVGGCVGASGAKSSDEDESEDNEENDEDEEKKFINYFDKKERDMLMQRQKDWSDEISQSSESTARSFRLPPVSAPNGYDYAFIKKIRPFEERRAYISKCATGLKAANQALWAREQRKAQRAGKTLKVVS